MTRDNNKKTHYVVLGGKGGGGQAESVEWDDILNKPEFATVATTGDYDDLTDRPTILTQWFGTQAEYDAIVTKDPNVIYNIEGSDNVQSDWNQTDTTADDYIKNKPTIPAAQVNSDWNSNSGVSQILNKPTLATVATTGSYSDLTNRPAVKEDLDLSTLTQAQYVDFYTNYNTYKANYDLNWGGMPIVSINSWQPDTSISPVPFIVLEYGIYGQSALMTGGDDEVFFGVQLIGADGSVTPYSSSMVFKQICHTASYNDLVDKPSVPAMETETLTFTLQGGTTKTIDFYVVPNYFYVEDISGSDNTLSIKKQSDSAPDVEVFYSTDRLNWTSMGTTTTTGITATVPANGKLYLKTTTDNWGNPVGYNTINCNNNFNVGGNIMSLIYSDNFVGKTVFPTNNSYVFYNLFSNSVIVSAGNLLLPATTVPANGYTTMFNGCTSLTTAPAVLPATSVGFYGYNSMFNGCTSLTTAPEIYCNDFGSRACRSMFANCTNLIKIVTYSTKLGIQSHADWLYKVSATGDFFNLGGANYSSGESGIPTGWTVHTSL